MNRKPRLSNERLGAISDEMLDLENQLRPISQKLVTLTVELMNAYPIHTRHYSAAKDLSRAQRELSEARVMIENAVFRLFPEAPPQRRDNDA